jgi:hypothetical protein
MGQVLQFRLRQVAPKPDEDVLDLVSAVDFAIRDLRDILPHVPPGPVREQAEACRSMLQAALDAAC